MIKKIIVIISIIIGMIIGGGFSYFILYNQTNQKSEVLLPEPELSEGLRGVYGIDKNALSIKDIVKLANLFVVPYRTMVKRLHEIGVCSKREYEKFKEYTDEQAKIWRNRLGLSVPVRKDEVGLSNLVDKAMELYEKNLITYEKLEYLLELAELTPEKMGIALNNGYEPPTDDELDAIMEA